MERLQCMNKAGNRLQSVRNFAARSQQVNLYSKHGVAAQNAYAIRSMGPMGTPTQAVRIQTVCQAASVQDVPTLRSNKASRTLLCTSLTAPTVEGMLKEADEAVAAGADIVELRVDFLKEFAVDVDLPELLNSCPLPAIVTYRPNWEGGQYSGDEASRLAALRYACILGAAYVDIELKVAEIFFAASGAIPQTTKIIVSSHDYEKTSDTASLLDLMKRCEDVGADIVKFATTATDVTDAHRVLSVLEHANKPTIALAMGERGLLTRLLAPKFGGFLTFGALSPERQSAPGQPTLGELRQLYGLQRQHPGTKVLGIIGNPVGHSKSPAIHNACIQQDGLDIVYVPYLVDDMAKFLDTFTEPDWIGFTVTIPHKEGALAGAHQADELAAQIGAANTLVRGKDGSLKAYNTDCFAAISAIERGLNGGAEVGSGAVSPLQGLKVVVVGAGGAGKALAFGAAAKGASVVIANRSIQSAENLAANLAAAGASATACSLQDVSSAAVTGDVLINTTSVGMQPDIEATPVAAEALKGYKLVFDAVYTPRHTRLLRDAAAAGCSVVTGDEMFIEQAAEQYRLFTGREPDVGLMRRIVLGDAAES